MRLKLVSGAVQFPRLDPPVLVADPSAARRLLGWEPVCSDLEIILSTALRWHGTHPAGYRA